MLIDIIEFFSKTLMWNIDAVLLDYVTISGGIDQGENSNVLEEIVTIEKGADDIRDKLRITEPGPSYPKLTRSKTAPTWGRDYV